MKSAIIPVVMLLALPACNIWKAESTAQRYYAVKSDYELVLETAVAYKEHCDAMPTSDRCHGHVDAIKDINNDIKPMLEKADDLRESSKMEELDDKINAIRIKIAALKLRIFNAKKEES